MNNCLFFKGDACQCLVNVYSCPEKCKFRKTEREYYEDQAKADERLKAKGLERVMIRTDNGPIISVREIEC